MSQRSITNSVGIRRVAAAILLLLACFPGRGLTQIRSQVVLPSGSETAGGSLYTALGCLDNHNCLACELQLLGKYHAFVDRTTDGGKSWKRFELPIELTDMRSGYLQGVYFIDSLNVIVTGNYGLILRSNDGGGTWFDRSFPSRAASAQAAFSDSAHGVIAMGGGTVLRTTNAGVDWDSLPGFPYAALNSPKLIGQDTVLVLGAHNRLYMSTPNGVDSISLPFDRTPTDTGGYRSISGISWYSGRDGLAGGLHYVKDSNGKDVFRQLLASTSDNGRTWTQVLDQDFGDHIWGGTEAYSGAGLMFGDQAGSLRWTQNWRGSFWAQDSVIADSTFYEISEAVFLDSATVLAIIDNGSILFGPSGGEVIKFRLPETQGVQYFEAIVRNTTVYPNPASNYLTVRVPAHRGIVRLIDILGREARRIPLSESGLATFSVFDLTDGVYSVMMESNGAEIPLSKALVRHY